MSDKVIGGRGHKISPVGKGTSKIAYSPCPKIDPDNPDNFLSLGNLPPPNGNLRPFSTPNYFKHFQIDDVKFLNHEKPS